MSGGGSISFYIYRATSGVGGAGSGTLGGPIGASGALDPVGASDGPGSFDPRGSSWSPLDEGRPVGALEAWPLRAGRTRPLTEVILIQTGWLTRWVWRF